MRERYFQLIRGNTSLDWFSISTNWFSNSNVSARREYSQISRKGCLCHLAVINKTVCFFLADFVLASFFFAFFYLFVMCGRKWDNISGYALRDIRKGRKYLILFTWFLPVGQHCPVVDGFGVQAAGPGSCPLTR